MGSTSHRSTTISDLERRDRREASAAFDVIENQIVPSFYERGDDGLPHDWLDRITTNWATLGWNVIASRMVRDYVTQYYEPAAVSSDTIVADDAGPARELAAWKRRVTEAWPGVRVTIDAGASSIEPGAATDERRRRRPRRSGHPQRGRTQRAGGARPGHRRRVVRRAADDG